MHLSGKPTSKLDFPIRTVVDYHLDRPGVEALQSVELTGTNSPIDLFSAAYFYPAAYRFNLILDFFNVGRSGPRSVNT